jgi:hypothetical protein
MRDDVLKMRRAVFSHFPQTSFSIAHLDTAGIAFRQWARHCVAQNLSCAGVIAAKATLFRDDPRTSTGASRAYPKAVQYSSLLRARSMSIHPKTKTWKIKLLIHNVTWWI